ncbi:caspase domain-containing protein [Suillus clintonianus]|uniref:caspase domain-containing protein n=1 Tax=Suillus clintonianus TaxID=1904413 RepID=UPI001B870C10|nr:caspase domain-containing protein [Suillus clintonianus]KAG2137979.1 caspase domain-containing protein [Suillus clintonianus]
MLSDTTKTDINSLPAAFDLLRRDRHTCKRQWMCTSWELELELSVIQQTSILEITLDAQEQHNRDLVEFLRCSRSSSIPYWKHHMPTPYWKHHMPTPYLKLPMPEASDYISIPMYTQPSPPPPGRKRALLIGINYIGQRCELRGCNNDIRHILPCLINQWGYDPRDIVQLTDDGNGPLPTKHNILVEMHRLAFYARAGDSMFFHFSGHGSQVRDLDGDEVDGYDEVICPVDYQQSGVINDDEIHDIMVKPLPAGSRLTALFDSCHSGTVLDLPYLYDSGQRRFVYGVTPDARTRKHSQAQVVCFSGCGDSEESESVTLPDQPIGGLMTFAFKHVFSCTGSLTFQSRFEQICAFVRTTLPDARQQPQFSCSNPLDTTLPFYI